MQPMRTHLLVAMVSVLLASCQPELGPNGIPIAGEGALVCGAAFAPIAAVQGNQAMSPVVGEVVEVEARISAKFIDGLGGFFLVSEPGSEDQDAASSEGLFVRQAEKLSWPVGTKVRVRATVAELDAAPDTQTALIELSQLIQCDKPIKLSTRDVASAGNDPQFWERFEGERIGIAGPVTVVGNDSLLRQGALTVSFDGRDFAPTERHPPGPEARALAQANLATRLILDDGRLDEYPGKLWHLPQPLSPEASYRTDSQLRDIEGVLEQRDGEYRVQLTRTIGEVVHAPRPQAPPQVEGDLRIASFNVLNFFNGDGAGGGFPTTRGAQNEAAFKRQAAKIVSALVLLDADIVALMEVENDGFGPTSAVVDLVTRLNKARGKDAGDYVIVDPKLERVGSDEITVALIYRSSRVHTVGDAAVLLDAPFDRWSRAPIAQRFEAGELDFTVVANHFKSKGCQDARGTEQNQEDGQGCFNARRVDSARVLADWLATDPVRSGHDRVLLIGDLNAYGAEDPVRHLLSRGYVDVLAAHLAEPSYSYVFNGESGRLDHALASAALAEMIGGVGEWHINADESQAFEYGQPDYDRRALKTRYRADPYRSSDHDPLLLGLLMPEAAGVPAVAPN